MEHWAEGREPRIIRYKTAEFLGCHNWIYFVPFKMDRVRSSGLVLPEQDTKPIALCIGTGPGRWDYGRWREVNVCKTGDVLVVHSDPKRGIIFDVTVGEETIYFVEDTQVAMVWPQGEGELVEPARIRPALVSGLQ